MKAKAQTVTWRSNAGGTALPLTGVRSRVQRGTVRVMLFVIALVVITLCIRPADAGATSSYASAVLADHPVSYWQLNDAPGSSVAADEEGLNPGQISGATLGEPGPFAGSSSMRFNGSGSVDLGTDPSLRPPESWSLEAWFKASASEAAQCAGNFGGDACYLYRYHAFGFVLALHKDGTVSAGVSANNTTGYSVGGPPIVYADEHWHYVAVVRAPGSFSLFIDGKEVGSTPTALSTTYTCCENVAAIANDGACSCSGLTGWESEVAFYNYPLTAAQVEAHYAATGVSCNSTSTAATLANFGAQICNFVSDETTIAQQQAALLEVAGSFPHVYQTGPNSWAYPAVTPLSWIELIPTSVANELLKKKVDEGQDAFKEILADKSGLKDLEEELPCTTKGIKSLKTAQEEDEKAAEADQEGAEALVAVLKGASDGTTASKVVGSINDASMALANKLTALVKALLELSGECMSAGNAEFQAEIREDEIEISTDINTVTSSQEYIALVPTDGGAVLSGSGVINSGGTSNATIVTHQPDFSNNGALPSDANPSGVSPSGSIFSTPLSCGSLSLTGEFLSISCGSPSTTNIGAGDQLTISGSGFESQSSLGIFKGSTPERLAVIATNSEGSFSATVQIPADTEPGAHELYALGTAPDGSVQVLGISITVTAPDTVPTAPTVNSKVTILGMSMTVTALAPPVITNVAQSHRRWREGNKPAQMSRRNSKLPLGTTFSFSLNEPASVSIAFTQQEVGRKVKGKCVASSKKKERGSACKRGITRGTLAFTGHAGINTVSFQGSTGKHKLKPGNYTLMITATNASGHSSPQSLSFMIAQ